MPNVDEHLAREVGRLYWESDAPVAEIADRLGISRRALYEAVLPVAAEAACAICAAGLVYTNRSARTAGEAVCPECGAAQDLSLLRELNAEAGSALRRAAERSEAAAGAAPLEAEPEVEQLWTAGSRAPIRTAAAQRRTRLLTLGGVALAGIAAGAVAIVLASRRRGAGRRPRWLKGW